MSPDNPGYSGPLAANEEPETQEIDVEHTDKSGRLLGCTVAWDGFEALWVECWDDSGRSVELDADTMDAVVQKALGT